MKLLKTLGMAAAGGAFVAVSERINTGQWKGLGGAAVGGALAGVLGLWLRRPTDAEKEKLEKDRIKLDGR